MFPKNYSELNRQSSLLYWYPKVCEILPVPRTVILELSEEEKDALRGAFDNNPIPERLIAEIRNAGRKIGYPLFLRTDQLSGKHNYENTCFVRSENELVGHCINLVEESICADMIGESYDALVFREFLVLDSAFKAFWGHLPIAKERRYFVRDGKVECWHPYWPENAILGPIGEELPENWKELLAVLNTHTPEEIDLLKTLAENWPFEGYWSVDFACDRDGNWYFIDAARGELSWHADDCPYNPQPPEKKMTPEEREEHVKSLFEKVGGAE